MKAPLERLLSYVAVDTQSDPDAGCIPSTPGQFELARMVCGELEALGAEDIELTDHCHIYAKLPGNTPGVPAVGFIAHLDTSPALSGKDIRPRVVSNYDGGDIVLNEETGCTLRIEEYPELKRYKGGSLVVTDGTTLLGSDDKSGITEIIGMLEYYAEHPELPHGDICVGFTPDEEIGHGTDCFDIERFGAKLAYTVDGADLGKISFENLNSAEARITVAGTSIHPGRGKNKMKNAALMAIELVNMLPAAETPSHTEGYEGFFHLNGISGDVELTVMDYIVRDHDMEKFLAKKEQMQKAAEYLNQKYGAGTIELIIKDSYFNMKELILPHMYLIDLAKEAMEELGIQPLISPIRGGTDGARLCYMGLPCPNLCTGGHNFHGKFEYIPIQSMEKMVELLLKITQKFAEKL